MLRQHDGFRKELNPSYKLRGEYLGLLGPSHRPGFRAKRAANAARFGAFFAAFRLKTASKRHFF
jgi:hypothetical protein